MKKYVLFIFMAVGVSICLAQNATAETVVLELSGKKFRWMTQGRVDSLERVLDERLKFIHSNGWVQSKADVINDMKSNKLVYEKITVTENDVRVYDDMALVVGKGKFSGSVNGTSFSIDLIFTEVYTFKNNTWLFASRQATRVP